MMQAIRHHGVTGAIVSSNWLAQIDLDMCRGCKKCYQACPAEAISIIDNEGKGLPALPAQVAAALQCWSQPTDPQFGVWAAEAVDDGFVGWFSLEVRQPGVGVLG